MRDMPTSSIGERLLEKRDDDMFPFVGGIFRDLLNKTLITKPVALLMCTSQKWLAYGITLVIVLASFHLVVSEARASSDFKRHISCYRDSNHAPKHPVRGFFSGREGARSEHLVLSGPPEIGRRGCVIQYENGSPVRIGADWDYASYVLACRDPATGLEQVVVHVTAGQQHAIQVWSVEPATGTPVRLYKEAWGEGGGRTRDLLSKVDGTCRWREREKAHLTFQAAMKALRIGASLKGEGPTFVLPRRRIPPGKARRWLRTLHTFEELIDLEGAIYADEAGHSSWRVVQVTGPRLCDGGLVLLLDRRQDSWRTIYDIPSVCSHTSNRVRGMVVKGDQLFVSICFDCYGWGLYHDRVINLRTLRTTPISPESNAPGPLEPPAEVGEYNRFMERFMVHDLDKYLSTD